MLTPVVVLASQGLDQNTEEFGGEGTSMCAAIRISSEKWEQYFFQIYLFYLIRGDTERSSILKITS